MNILITAGPTREWLDPVRFLSNPATGRLGYLLAAESVKMNHRVFLVSGPVATPVPQGVELHRVESAVEMESKVKELFPVADVLFMTAAVSDWRPRFRRCKIKRGFRARMSLTLFANPDILAVCGRLKSGAQVMVGFALETGNFIESAREKVRKKNLDFILVNSPDFFGAEKANHQSFLLDRQDKVVDLSGRPKEYIARFLLKNCLTTSCNRNPS